MCIHCHLPRSISIDVYSSVNYEYSYGSSTFLLLKVHGYILDIPLSTTLIFSNVFNVVKNEKYILMLVEIILLLLDSYSETMYVRLKVNVVAKFDGNQKFCYHHSKISHYVVLNNPL